MQWTFTSCSLLLLFNFFGTDASFSSEGLNGIITDKSSIICQFLRSFLGSQPQSYDSEKIENACDVYRSGLTFFKDLGYSKCRYHVGPILMFFYSTDTSKQASVWDCQDPSLNNIFVTAIRHYHESPPLESEIAPGSVLFDPLTSSSQASASAVSKLIEAPEKALKAVVLEERSIAVLSSDAIITTPAAINSIGMECELKGSLVALVRNKADCNEFTSSDLNGKLDYSQVLYQTTTSIGGVPILSFTLDGSESVEMVDVFIDDQRFELNILDHFKIPWLENMVNPVFDETKVVKGENGEYTYNEKFIFQNEYRNVKMDDLNELILNDEEGYTGGGIINTKSVGKGTKDGLGYFRLIEIISGPAKAGDESGLNIRKVQRAIQILLSVINSFRTTDKNSNSLCDQTLTYFARDSFGGITEKKFRMARLQTIINSYNEKLGDDELAPFKLFLTPFILEKETFPGEITEIDLTQTHEYMMICNLWQYAAGTVSTQVSIGMPISSYANGCASSFNPTSKSPINQLYDYAEMSAMKLMSYATSAEFPNELNANDRLELTGFFSLLNLATYFDTLSYFNQLFSECREFPPLATDAATVKNRIPFLPKLDLEDVKKNMPKQFQIISKIYEGDIDKFLKNYLIIDQFKFCGCENRPTGARTYCFELFQLFNHIPVDKNKRAQIGFVSKTIPVLVEELPPIGGLNQIRLHTVVESRMPTSDFNRPFKPIPSGDFKKGASTTNDSIKKLIELWKFPQLDCVDPDEVELSNGCVRPAMKPPIVVEALTDLPLFGVASTSKIVPLGASSPVLPNPDHFSEVKAELNKKSRKHRSNTSRKTLDNTMHEQVSKVKGNVLQNNSKKSVSLKGSKRNL